MASTTSALCCPRHGVPSAPTPPVAHGYLVFLLIVATGGWAMSAYDFNLQIMSLSDIAEGLLRSSTRVGMAVVPTNLYIVYWLTHFDGFSSHSAVLLMFGCAAIGVWFYIFAGLLGVHVSRRKILFWTAIPLPITTFAFMWTHSLVVSSLVYFFVYRATNGT